jgi:hypothetical protein
MSPEDKQLYNKAYREANKERLREYGKAYREANKERIKAYKTSEEYKANRRATRDLVKNREQCREYHVKNYKTKILPRHKEYYARPDIQEKLKAYRKKDYQTKGIERNILKIKEVKLNYVKEILKRGGALKGVEIPIELLETKQLLILIKRELKNEQRI